jgi:hypothetical protein
MLDSLLVPWRCEAAATIHQPEWCVVTPLIEHPRSRILPDGRKNKQKIPLSATGTLIHVHDKEAPSLLVETQRTKYTLGGFSSGRGLGQNSDEESICIQREALGLKGPLITLQADLHWRSHMRNDEGI